MKLKEITDIKVGNNYELPLFSSPNHFILP